MTAVATGKALGGAAPDGVALAAAAEDARVAAWADAVTAALLFSIDPVGTGGMVVRAAAGPVRDRYLRLLADLQPAGAPWRRLPAGIADGRLIGGLDLSATLAAGRPVAERGLLADSHGGVLVVPMAERLEPATAARIAAVLDDRRVVVERDGIAAIHPARFGVVALDEGGEDERPPPTLAERLGLHVDLTGVALAQTCDGSVAGAADVAGARDAIGAIGLDTEAAEALAVAAIAFGAGSLRVDLLAAAAARASAALAGADRVGFDDVATAVRLVVLPRATRLPAEASDAEAEPPPEAPPPEPRSEDDAGEPDPGDGPLAERVVAAARASLSPQVIAILQAGTLAPRVARHQGRGGPDGRSPLRGRPLGARRGDPRSGLRLDLVETLRAAAPWQSLRRAEAKRPGAAAASAGPAPLVEIRKGDCRVVRYRHRTRSTVVFVVDASGSSALHRLAEVKGAVEILLGSCYVRRDRVALIAFRGRAADLVLPPTSSLTRARAAMVGLPGGGGTPLAAAVDAGIRLADGIRRRGETALLVVLTDGAANVALDGTGGRARAEADALAAAGRARFAGTPALVIDTAPRPGPRARALAEAMGARYLALPQADAAALGVVLKAAAPAAA